MPEKQHLQIRLMGNDEKLIKKMMQVLVAAAAFVGYTVSPNWKLETTRRGRNGDYMRYLHFSKDTSDEKTND